MLNRVLFVLCGLSFCGMSAFGGIIDVSLSFNEEKISYSEAEGYAVVDFEGGFFPNGQTGAPRLPVILKQVLLPEGAELSEVTYEVTDRVMADGLNLLPAQPSYSLNEVPGDLVLPDPKMYALQTVYPQSLVKVAGTGMMRGRTLVSLNIYPLSCIPADGELRLNQRMDIQVHYTLNRAGSVSPVPSSRIFSEMLNGLVVNPETISRTTAFGTNALDYVIITGQELTNAFAVLSNHRTNTFGAGRTGVVGLDDVLSISTGLDDPDKLRNYIKELVASNGVSYVVFGGDDTVVPVRYCYADSGDGPDEAITNMPTDLYYAGLDGNWDANGNHLYGEVADNVDMLPDVIVSRIPIRTADQASVYIEKVIARDEGEYDDLNNRFFISGTKGFNMWYGNERSTDMMLDGYCAFREHQPVSDVEEWNRRLHRNCIQPFWSAGELDIFFDTLTTWDDVQAGDFQQTPERFEAVYNLGWEHQYYLTHGAEDGYAIEMVDDEDMFMIANLKNVTNMTCFIATPACETAHYDGTEDPCFAEAFLRKADSGTLIYYGHARNGQGEQIGTYGGPTPDFIAAYYQYLFSNSATFGEGASASKASMVGLCNTNGGYRWTQFGLTLLGDAAIGVRMSEIPAVPILTSAVSTNQPSAGILVDWLDRSDDENGFEIQRRENGGDWNDLVSMAAGSTQFLDSSVTSNVFYMYRLRSTNAAGESLFSNVGGLLAGALPPDAWDPGDDVASGATLLTNMTTVYTGHGPHTLSADDTNDWFAFEVKAGMAYWLSTYAEENLGGLYGRVFSDETATNLVAEDGDQSGLGHFAFYLTPEADGTYYLQVEPNSDRDSAHYMLYARSDVDLSGSEALATALGTTGWVWATSTETGDPWVAVTNDPSGELIVQSGDVYYNETSWIETYIPSSGNLGVRFKLDSVTNSDYLVITVNGQSAVSYSGQYDWTVYNTFLHEPSTVRVSFARSNNGSSGADAAWLDAIWLDDFPKLNPGESCDVELTAGSTYAIIMHLTMEGRAMLAWDYEGSFVPTIYDEDENEVSCSQTPYGLVWACSDGDYALQIKASEEAASVACLLRQRHMPINDFDGDKQSDPVLYMAASGAWSIYASSAGPLDLNWGCNQALPVPADYTGDAKTDVAVYFPEDGAWVLRTDEGAQTVNWGWSEAVPVQGDYDGDGEANPAVFYPEQGRWSVWQEGTAGISQSWGWKDTVPVPGDYDGDGRTDYCVYWPEQGKWYILYANGNQEIKTMGWSEALPMSADADGDFVDDLLLYWPENGTWYVMLSSTASVAIRNYGWSEAVPVPANYNGYAMSELALYWPAGGIWYIRDAISHEVTTLHYGWSAAWPAYPQFWINLWCGRY